MGTALVGDTQTGPTHYWAVSLGVIRDHVSAHITLDRGCSWAKLMDGKFGRFFARMSSKERAASPKSRAILRFLSKKGWRQDVNRNATTSWHIENGIA